MSDTESLDYLQTGFDPNSLTVPRIRSILVSYDIPYPANAKKPQLIEIFNENVLPQSRKILAARSRAKRSSRGITDVESSQESTVDGELMPPPPTPRVRSKKSSIRVKQEESESDTATTRTPGRKTPRATSRHSRASDAETGHDGESVRKTARKAKKSDTPVVKAEDEDNDAPRRILDGSAFSHDNPFQSGSSPLSDMRSPSGERRRHVSGRASSAHKDPNRRKSHSTTRKHVETPKSDSGITAVTSTTFELPVSQLNGLKQPGDIEPSEEFTPEEQMELVRERSQNGQNAVVNRRPKKTQSRGVSIATPIWVVLLTILSGYAYWYRQEKLAVGYCEVGRESHHAVSSKVDLPDWALVLAEPVCEPCPQHAYCYEGLVAQCEPDFLVKPHPLSLGGLVPLPPTCEPDGEKVRRIKVVADRAVEELRERRAKFECGDLVDEKGRPIASAEVKVDELKREVSKKRRKAMSESEFEDLWVGAVEEIIGREEVESKTDGNSSYSGTTRLSSTSLARLPFTCAVRRSFRLTLERHRFQILTIIILTLLAVYSRQRYKTYKATIAAVPHLVNLTLDRLATQAALHIHDASAFPHPWISIGQLRDDILRSEHSISKREATWSRVRAIVQTNANIRASQREDRNGEISRVWEWIGAVRALEPGEESRRRSGGGRVSWGTYGDASSPVSGTDGGPEMVQQKWMEGRPIY